MPNRMTRSTRRTKRTIDSQTISASPNGWSRREFVSATIAGSVLGLAQSCLGRQAEKPKRILLRSSWQTVNIGDIAHTPGVLHLLEESLPETEVWLWPSKVDRGVREMLQNRFPRLKILEGKQDQDQALQECDLLLHGSGPSLVAEKDIERWIRETSKPFGVYGITLPTPLPDQPASVGITTDKTIEILGKARFVFFRDSVSLAHAKQRGCKCPVLEFAPDGAFACDLRNDGKATDFLRSRQLESKKFVCCIPRYRYTPYWRIHPDRKLDPVKDQRNEEMKEHDHAPLREAILKIVDETEFKVLLCPEDQTQMAIAKEMLWDKLPERAKSRVVYRDEYWLTDEALSIYVQSAGLFGLEMHSPIMCIGNGIPAIVGRFAEQTSKGIMWRDIGLGEWLFDMDVPADVVRYPQAVLAMVKEKAASRSLVAKGREIVRQRQSESMEILRKNLLS